MNNATVNFDELEGQNIKEHIICFHGSLSSSKQWNDLKGLMKNRFKVTTVDLLGYGSGSTNSDYPMISLEDEIEPLITLVNSMQGSLHLVGHSYGAMVALKLAQRFPTRVKTLSLFEPVMFSLLFDSVERQEYANEVSRLIHSIQVSCRSGNNYRAAEKFIDYWSGDGTWGQIPFDLKARFSNTMNLVLNNFEAVLSDPLLVDKLKYLTMPVQLIYGKNSPKPATEISKILRRKLSASRLYGLHNVGHMGPITHSDLINGAIETFIEQHSRFDFDAGFSIAA